MLAQLDRSRGTRGRDGNAEMEIVQPILEIAIAQRCRLHRARSAELKLI